jgi:RNA polymerase sigma factor (sigma-70 family)
MNTRSLEGPPLDDAELVRRAQRGEVDSYGELVRRYQGIAHRTAHLITGGSADAEDAAQAAFVKAYYALERFQADRPFRPWLLRIVANEAKNRRRWLSRHAALELVEAEAPAAPEGGSPEAAAEEWERRRALLGAVNGLRHDDREVIACRYFLELSEAETAEILGVAPGTVKSRLSRALVRLRTALVAEGIDMGAVS